MILLLSLIFTTSSFADIFGKDDRHRVYPNSPNSKVFNSVAVGVIESLLTLKNDSTYDIYADFMTDSMCKDEAFYNNTKISYACTGFLVADDLLITAGHCATNIDEVHHSPDLYCKAYTWMFDYVENRDGSINVDNVPKDKVYRCKEIIYAVSDEHDPKRDFALIRLNRKVKGRTPLKLSFDEVKKNHPVSMYGHPMGMPMKLTNNARVILNNKNDYSFITNLDAFAGNSGSPVLNAKNETVGVLVSGNPSNSTYYDTTSKCERYNRCDNNGRNCVEITIPGEGFPNTNSSVQKLSKHKKLLKSFL